MEPAYMSVHTLMDNKNVIHTQNATEFSSKGNQNFQEMVTLGKYDIK